MSFSAATCLTLTPSNVTSFDIFLGQNNYTTPFISDVSLSDLTSPNCPYIIENIPNGTTYLSFKDSSGIYCISIPVVDNDICSNCSLGFSDYSASTISQLYCGELTGSCEISDYLINWYGPDSTTTLYRTSGPENSIFNPDFTHPFSTSSTAPSVLSGVYTPVIDKIVIDGITFSNTGGTGNVLFDGNCLPTTNVSPLYCFIRTNTNTNNLYSAFTNNINFNYNTGGSPQQQTITLKVSASTKYLVWGFRGYENPDRIRLKFSGTNYSTEIGLEDFVIGNPSSVGGTLTTNFSASTYPKSANTSFNFVKYTCLTGLTIYDNENIIIDIIPAVSNTNWDFYISCLEDYECNDCISTQSIKIIGSSITGITQNCDAIRIRFNLSGCTYPDNTSDYISYYLSNNTTEILQNNYTRYCGLNNTIIPSNTTVVSDLTYHNNISCGNNLNQRAITLPSCTTGSTPTIYNKTFLTDGSGRGVFGFTGSSTFISTYYNAINNAFLGLSPYTSDWSGSTNSSDISYYRFYQFTVPSKNDPETCGDGRNPKLTFLHHTSTYITGTTISGVTTLYYLNLTANTISKDILFGNCKINCDSLENSVVSRINNSSTGDTFNFPTGRTFSNGIYYNNPLSRCEFLSSGNTPSTGITYSSYFPTPDWSFNTYPFSGNPATIIPSLSGSVCNYNNTGVNFPTYNSFNKYQYKYYYQVRLTNPSDVNDFDIWASPINNFSYSGAPALTPFYELAYRYSGGSVTFSSSTYII